VVCWKKTSWNQAWVSPVIFPWMLVERKHIDQQQSGFWVVKDGAEKPFKQQN
jgi:hypothetical protein